MSLITSCKLIHQIIFAVICQSTATHWSCLFWRWAWHGQSSACVQSRRQCLDTTAWRPNCSGSFTCVWVHQNWWIQKVNNSMCCVMLLSDGRNYYPFDKSAVPDSLYGLLPVPPLFLLLCYNFLSRLFLVCMIVTLHQAQLLHRRKKRKRQWKEAEESDVPSTANSGHACYGVFQTEKFERQLMLDILWNSCW